MTQKTLTQEELLEHLRKMEVLLFVASKNQLDYQISRQISDKSLSLDYKMELVKNTYSLLKTIYDTNNTIKFLEDD